MLTLFESDPLSHDFMQPSMQTVVAQFYAWFQSYFPLFYIPYYLLYHTQLQSEIKIEPQHSHTRISVRFSFIPCLFFYYFL